MGTRGVVLFGSVALYCQRIMAKKKIGVPCNCFNSDKIFIFVYNQLTLVMTGCRCVNKFKKRGFPYWSIFKEDTKILPCEGFGFALFVDAPVFISLSWLDLLRRLLRLT